MISSLYKYIVIVAHSYFGRKVLPVGFCAVRRSRKGARWEDHRIGNLLALLLPAEQLDERECEREGGA